MNTVKIYFSIGLATALVLLALHSILGSFHWWTYTGYVLIGYIVVLFVWGAERLWFHTIAPMIEEHFSTTAYLSRVPFWFIAGGVGYTVGMLITKKYDLMGFYDIPVKPIFIFGGKIGIALEVPLQMISFYIMRKRGAGGMTHHSNSKS
jgi:hypothetical protein